MVGSCMRVAGCPNPMCLLLTPNTVPASPDPAANRSCLPVPITENSGLLNYSVNPQKKKFFV